MQLSDLDNVLSVGTICYQFGESFLNVILLHKMDNLLSVYIFLSELDNLVISLDEMGGSFLPQFRF